MNWAGYGIVVRHGVTWWDSVDRGSRIEGALPGGKEPSERVTGWLDLPLRHEGQMEALRSGQTLAQYPISMIVSSPLSRTMMTARAISQLHPRVPFSSRPELRPWNTGIYSGQLASKVQKILDQAVTHPDTPIPMGETFNQFVQRFLPFAWRIIQSPELPCLVTHGMNVEVLVKYDKTGSTNFGQYTGINASIGPGEALFVTPQGVQELVA